ncbi:MAG: chemotaxis protein CheW [Planctomycetota bacterium]
MTTTLESTRTYSIVHIDDITLGIPIDRVREINQNMNIVPVPGAPRIVRGIINLRGAVLTVIDVRAALRLPVRDDLTECCNIIVSCDDETVALLVDSVGNFVDASPTDVNSAPGNVNAVAGEYLTGILNRDDHLVGIIDIDALLLLDEHTDATNANA